VIDLGSVGPEIKTIVPTKRINKTTAISAPIFIGVSLEPLAVCGIFFPVLRFQSKKKQHFVVFFDVADYRASAMIDCAPFFLLASEANSTAGQNDSSSGLIDPDKALLPFQILEETPQEHAIVPPKELSSLRNLTSHVASPCPYGHKLTHSLSQRTVGFSAADIFLKQTLHYVHTTKHKSTGSYSRLSDILHTL
jgi:hypothetical protein